MAYQTGDGPVSDLKVLITAAEAYPALERLFLETEREIWAGFRVFDLETRLRGDDARQIGETWFDLLEHTLNRGVSITLVISDFDAILATDYHRKSWESARQLAGAETVSDRGTLKFRIAAHPARIGIIPRLFFRRRVKEKLDDRLADENTPGLHGVAETDLFELSPATHHQKLAVFDRSTVYIGGLDLDERRFDTPDHERPAQETWHDVQVIVTGPIAQAAQQHLETFEAVVEGKSAPPEPRAGFVRTLSTRRTFAPFHISPRTAVDEIEARHLEALRHAERLIYLETQYFRHRRIADALSDAAQANPELRLILVLPAAPEDVAFKGSSGQDARMGEHLQAQAVSIVQSGFGDRALICSPVQRRPGSGPSARASLAGAPIVYVHSKVSIFDTREAIVSSANLNGRSMKWDTEAGVHLTSQHHVTQLRDRVLRHWVPTVDPASEADVFAGWTQAVHLNLGTPPDKRRSFLVPYDKSEAAHFGEAVPIAPDELV